MVIPISVPRSAHAYVSLSVTLTIPVGAFKYLGDASVWFSILIDFALTFLLLIRYFFVKFALSLYLHCPSADRKTSHKHR